MDMNIKREQKYFLAISNTQYYLRQMAKIKKQNWEAWDGYSNISYKATLRADREWRLRNSRSVLNTHRFINRKIKGKIANVQSILELSISTVNGRKRGPNSPANKPFSILSSAPPSRKSAQALPCNVLARRSFLVLETRKGVETSARI